MSRIGLSILVAAAAVALAGPPVAAAANGSTAQTIRVTMSEFKFSFATTKVHAGAVIFKLVNKGKLAHDLAIAGKKSALVKPGKTGTLKVTLKNGKYPYHCTVPGHAAAGMKGVLTVGAPATKPPKTSGIAFTGTYAGQASTKITGTAATISASGTGKGTLIGAGSITGQGTSDTSQQPCLPIAGTGTIKGAAGSILFKVASGASGCGDEGGHTFSITAHLTVVSATGKLAKAKGTLKLTGTYSHDSGNFSVKVSGTLTQ